MVQVSGVVAEYNGLTEIVASNITILSTENPLPAAVSISTGDLTEEYESVRVELSATCTQLPNEYGEWSADDGSGSVWVDDKLFAEADELIESENQYVVVGPVDFTYGNYKIQPRSEADVFQFFQCYIL